MHALLELRQISKAFPGVHALQNVDFNLRDGSIHALVGENGAGKSTLINLLSGVFTPDTGGIFISEKPVHFHDAHAARRHGIVTVHQEADLFPDLGGPIQIVHLEADDRKQIGFVEEPLRVGQPHKSHRRIVLIKA